MKHYFNAARWNEPHASGLTVTPCSVTFGAVEVDSTAMQQVLIANTGEHSQHVFIDQLGPPFTVSENQFELAFGASQLVTLSFEPAQAGLVTQMMGVHQAGGESLKVSINGTGVNVSALQGEPWIPQSPEVSTNRQSLTSCQILLDRTRERFTAMKSMGMTDCWQRPERHLELRPVINPVIIPEIPETLTGTGESAMYTVIRNDGAMKASIRVYLEGDIADPGSPIHQTHGLITDNFELYRLARSFTLHPNNSYGIEVTHKPQSEGIHEADLVICVGRDEVERIPMIGVGITR